VGEKDLQVIIDNVVRIVNPTYELKKWIKENYTISNPEYAKKLRMGFWVGNTPKELRLYEIDGDDWVLPYGVLRPLLIQLKNIETLFDVRFAEQPKIDYGGKEVPLYDYQQEAVRWVVRAKFGILQSAAGSGKTQMGIALIKEHGVKALWLTHTLDLLNQSKERALQYIDKSLIGTITEGKVEIGKGITFATVQTMSKLDLTQYKDLWGCVIVDECHRVAGTPTSMTMFYKVLNNLSAKYKVGLSATVHRADDLITSTFALLGGIVYQVPDEAVADKIMKVGIKPVYTDIGIDRSCQNTDGTLNYQALISYLTGKEERNWLIVKNLIDEKSSSCLILSDRLEHLSTLISYLPSDMKKDAVMISGKMTSKKGKAEREQALEDMRTGKKKYLFATYSLAKEGLDVPRLERLFLTTPQKDYAVITQSIGRIARTHEGKKCPIAYDYVDNSGYLVRSYKKRCTTYRKNDCYFVEDEA
jgi:superfamily II DNA or RNA helicase